MSGRTVEVCLYFGGCRDCLPPIAGSWGVTARPVCLAPRGRNCQTRQAWQRAVKARFCHWSEHAVAGYRSDALMAADLVELHDVLPAIAPAEWPILHNFADDYTSRRIPWVVVWSGECFALVKRRVIR